MESKSQREAKSESGFASHPDTAKAHANVDQAKWLQESKDIINRFVQGLPKTSDSSETYTTFEDAYNFLARERHRVADKLGHGKNFDSDRTHDYGRFREEMSTSIEEIWLTSQKPQGWQGMRENLHNLLHALINKIETKNQYDKSKGKPYKFEDESCICRKRAIKKKKSGKKYVIYELMVRSPIKGKIDGLNHSDRLARIMMREFVDKADAILDPDFACMRMEYAGVNKYKRMGDFALANRYYQSLLNVPGTDDEKIKSFLENAGKLAHLLAHLLPVSLGNAGIMEWMIRGLAFKNGIDLGPFNYSESVSWDFKALLTPDREEYAKWFCEKAFVNARVLTKEEMEKGFVFRETSGAVAASKIPISSLGLGGFIQSALPATKLLHQAMPHLGHWYNFADEGFALQCNDEMEAKKLSEKLTKIFSGLEINVSHQVKPSNLAFVMINLSDTKKLAAILDLRKEELARVQIDYKGPTINPFS